MYAPPFRSSLTDGRTDSYSPSILPFSRNLFILGDFNCHHPLWNSRGTSNPCGEKVFNWVISSDLFSLNDPDTPTLLCHSSPDISFAPSSFTLSCSWEVLQDLGSDHSPILSLFLQSFTPTSIPLSTFRKLAGLILTPTVLLQKNYSTLLCTAALFTSLALNVAKSCILFSRMKHHPKVWWSAEVEGAVSERCKAFAAANRSDEDRQAYISASQRASLVIAKAEAWQTTFFSLSSKSNPKTVYSLLCSIAWLSFLLS